VIYVDDHICIFKDIAGNSPTVEVYYCECGIGITSPDISTASENAKTLAKRLKKEKE